MFCFPPVSPPLFHLKTFSSDSWVQQNGAFRDRLDERLLRKAPYFPRPVPPAALHSTYHRLHLSFILPAFILLLKTPTSSLFVLEGSYLLTSIGLLFLSSSSASLCHSLGVFFCMAELLVVDRFISSMLSQTFTQAKMKRIHMRCIFIFSFVCCEERLLATRFFSFCGFCSDKPAVIFQSVDKCFHLLKIKGFSVNLSFLWSN